MGRVHEQLNLAAAFAVAGFIIFQAAPVSAQRYPQSAIQAQALPSAYNRSTEQGTNQQAGSEPAMQYHLPPHSPNGAPFKWPAPSPSDLVVTTASAVEGCRITAYRGLVEGVAVREPSGMQDLAAQLQGMFSGGQIEAYGQVCEQGRVQAYNNLMRRARGMGANAVVGVRFDNEPLSIDKDHSATAVVCYGTAVVIEPVRH